MTRDVEDSSDFPATRAAIIAGGITAFLLIFQPLGISINSIVEALIVLGLAPLNFLVMLAVHRIEFPNAVTRVLGAALLIGGGNVAYLAFWNADGALLPTVLKVALVSGLVVAAVSVWNRQRNLQEKVIELSQPPRAATPELIVLRGENDREILRLPPAKLRFIKASGNYVDVHFEQNGAPTSSLLRSTLAGIEEQAPDGALHKCHRSYLVNLAAAQRIVSDSKGVRIEFEDGSSAPVSRAFRTAILEAANG